MIPRVHVEGHNLRSPITNKGTLPEPDELQAVLQRSAALADLTGWRVWRLMGETAPERLLHLPAIQPLGIGEIHSDGDRTLARLAQDEHLLLSHFSGWQPPSELERTVPTLITCSEISHGIALLLVAGAGAQAILRKLCGLDFNNESFPDLTVNQGSLARVQCTLMRRDWFSQPAYMLMVDRSVGRYLWDLLKDDRVATSLTLLDPTHYPAESA